MAASDKITFGASSDTKVTNTKNNTAKAYITGTTNAETNTGTQVFDDGVYLTDDAGGMHVSILEVGDATLKFDTDLQLLAIQFPS